MSAIAGDDTAAPSVRLFFAAWPDAVMRAGLAEAGAALGLAVPSQCVPAPALHLTLAFVGAVPASGVETVRAIGAVQRSPAFTVRFDAYDYWPKPEVVVVAAREISPALGTLWERLHQDLSAHGLALNPKRLRPHVTLVRKLTQDPVLPALSPFHWDVRELCLARSDTCDGRPAYTVIDTWPLLYDAEK